MIEKIEFASNMDSIECIRALGDRLNELIGAWNQHERQRVVSETTNLLMKMTQISMSLPLAVVHPMPDGELVIKRLVDNGQAQIVDGQMLELTADGRAQGQAIFDSLDKVMP